ncbi:hypothetical protein HispidOSU_030686, partial [Sigmodon hispidus]
ELFEVRRKSRGRYFTQTETGELLEAEVGWSNDPEELSKMETPEKVHNCIHYGAPQLPGDWVK